MESNQEALFQEKRDLLEAIVSFSPERLERVIQNSPPQTINLPSFGSGILMKGSLYDSVHTEENYDVEEMVAIGHEWFTYPLHVAVVCVYHAIKKDPLANYQLKRAMEVIDILISHGVNVELGTRSIQLLNIEGHDKILFSRDYPNNRAVNLALKLKQYPWSMEVRTTQKYLDIVVKKLDAAKPKKNELEDHVPTGPVLKGVASAYSKLLFSEDFSDITFKCSDGVSVPAHKNILAASSEYFHTAFLGSWAENHAGVPGMGNQSYVQNHEVHHDHSLHRFRRKMQRAAERRRY